ncbi:transposase family protein [Streptomyces mirabilis]|uniref:transposase family protein n=2 Tax=Streptomyces mirabilis TaxID=68239 RepID=UPI0033A591CC
MKTEMLGDVLFPGLDITVWQVVVFDDNLIVDAEVCGPPGRCPQCERPATRVRSRYWRRMAGLPVGRRAMILRLRVLRFFCDQRQCRRRTFVEQVAALAEPRHRCSAELRSAMRAVAVEFGGRPGRRLCTKLRLHGRRTVLLKQLTAPAVPARAPRVLGIDVRILRGRTSGA